MILGLRHPWSGNSQGKEMFLAPSADMSTGNYDIECWNHHPSVSTVTQKVLNRSKIKLLAIYRNLPMDVIVRLPHPRSGDSQVQETFLAPSANKSTRNYDIECSNHHPSLSTLSPKGLSCRKMRWWTIYTNLPVDLILRLPHPRCQDIPGLETFLAPSSDKQTRNYDIECSNYHPSL